MNQFKKTTFRLTITYSLVFFCFVWSFSGGLYLWTNNALGKGYVDRINGIVEQSNAKNHSAVELSDDTATIASDVALDRLRNIILVVNGIALVLIPTLAYQLSRRSLRPLVRSQAVQQQFVANASHELRTPLAVMLGELELATTQKRTSEEYVKTIKSTKREVERMTTLVRELLLLARVGSGDELHDPQEVRVDDVVNEALGSHRAAASRRGITIKVAMDDNLIIARGRKDLLVIALGNLLDNAVKFSGSNEEIVLRGSRVKNNVVIELSDTGQKIHPEKAAHLFDRFYQVDAGHASSGFGLGLAISKQIVELHRGSIRMEPNDRETTFSISLPA